MNDYPYGYNEIDAYAFAVASVLFLIGVFAKILWNLQHKNTPINFHWKVVNLFTMVIVKFVFVLFHWLKKGIEDDERND